MAAQADSIKCIIQTLQENRKKGNISQLMFLRQNTSQLILWYIVLMPNPDKDNTRKESYRPISFMNINAKTLIEILGKWFPTTYN